MRFVTDILAKANLVVDGSVTLNTTANASVDTDKFLVQDGTVVKYRTGSEVLSDIGAQGALTLTTTGTSGPATLVGNTLNIPQYQAVLTNPVTGTGTINYLPKWTGSTSLGDSIASESGTSFIVSTSGETKVNIRSASGSGNALFFTESSVADRYLIGSPAGSGDLVFRSNSFSFATGTERMRLSSSGNLGLGTASPQYSLDSTGVINSTGFGTFLGFSTPPGRTYNYVTSFGSGTTINYPGTGTLGFQYNYFANNEFYTTAGGTSNLLIVGFRNQNYIRSTVSTVPFQMVGFNNRFDMHDANDLSTLGVLNGVNSGFLREATASSLGGITTAYQFTTTTRLRSGFYTTTRWGNENLQVADTTASQASSITDYDFLLNTTNVGSSSGGPGTITNFYLLRHVTNIGATGTITNRWGLYLTDSSFKSYHAGNFLIGTSTDAGYKLNVNGNAKLGSGTSSLALKITGDDNYIEFDNPGTYIKGGGNLTIAATSNMFFNTSGSSRMTIASNGAVRLNAYGSGTFTGTPTYNLAVDASGNIIETAGGVVDGSGTTNYVPKWSDPNTLTNSIIYDNGTNVGIGTTSPNTILEAYQSVNSDAVIRITNPNSGTNAAAQFFAHNGTNATQFFHTGINYSTGGSQVVNYANLGGIYNASTGIALSAAGASGIILFGTGSSQTERMRITSGGNVGIGTSSPSSLLTVGGNPPTSGTISAVTSAQGVSLALSDNINSSLYVRNANGGAIIGTDGGNPIRFASGGNVAADEKARINPTGNFLIGTTSDVGYKLNVNGNIASNTGTSEAQVFVSNSTSSIYLFNSYAGNSFGIYDGTAGQHRILYDRGSNFLALYTGASERMRINSSGDVGIGTSSPSYKLDVVGTTARVRDAGNVNYVSLSIYGGVYLGGNGTGGVRYAGTETNDNFALVANNSEKVRITTGGYVGIGTSSPTGLLHLYGADPAFRIQNSGTGNMQFGQWDGTYNRIQSSGRDFLLISTDATNLLFSTNSAERMRITSGGAVGIGTTNPTANGLMIEKTGNHLFLRASSAAAGKYWNFDVTAANQLYIINNAGTQYLTITDGGNVGIGATTPGYKLEVQGTFFTSGNTILAGTGQNVIIKNHSNYPWFEGQSASAQIFFGRSGTNPWGIGADATYAFRLWDSSFGANYFGIFAGTGNVAIGTTTDSGFKLDVNGTGIVRGKFNVSANISDYTATFVNTNSSSYGIYIQAGGTYPAIDVYNYNATSLLASLKGNGQLRLAQYTSTSSFPGTAAGFIGFDSSGNLITVASAGGVSGSGTTNYVARWTASTTLGTGVLYDNGTNTSINTSSPVSTNLVGALTIWKTYNSDGGSVPSTTAQNYYENQSGLYVFGRNSTITLVGANSENNEIFFANASSKNYAVIGTFTGTTTAGGDMYFRTGGNNEAMRITTGGNVGIGTTSPAYKLDVAGTARTQGMTLYGFATGTSGGNLELGFDGSQGVVQAYNRSAAWIPLYLSGADIRFNPGGVEKMRLDSVGNLGIGTTAPSSQIHVFSTAGTSAVVRIEEETGQAGVRLLAGVGVTNRATRIDFLNKVSSTTVPRWTLINDYNQNGTNDFRFVKEDTSTSVLTLLQGGNVGIGTASPASKLHVFDSTTAATVLVRGIDANLASSYTLQHGGGGARTEFDGTWYMSFGSAETNFGLTPNLGGGLVFWWQSGATTVNPMTLKRSGNVVFSNSVGIGTASPDTTLRVVGTIRTSGSNGQVDADITSGAFRFYDGSTFRGGFGTDNWATGGSASNLTTYLNGGSYYIYSTSTGTKVVTVLSGGNVGIGTTSPVYKLDVRGYIVSDSQSNGSESAFYLGNSAHGLSRANLQNDIVLYTTAGDVRLSASTASTTHLIVKNSGNVGIGTTSPSYKLEVVGGAVNQQIARFVTADYPAHSIGLGVEAAGGNWGVSIFQDDVRRFTIEENGGILVGSSYQSSDAPANGAIIQGNVGIGSTTPDGRLYVERTATWSSGNLLGTNTVQYITYGSGASVGTVAISAVGAFQQVYFSGSATIGNGGRHGAIDSILTIGNTSSGTITVSQSSTLRAMSSISAATYFNPGSSTTITHLAGIRVLPDINTGAGAVTVNNKYGILIGDASGGSGSITYTTRWGIYQEGASDNNYFAAKVLIGTTTATSDALYVNGTAYINGNMTVNGTVTELSSANYKRNISTLENTLEKVDKMRAVSYNRVGGIKKEIGLIAEEVEQVYPEFVEYDNNGRPMGLNYARLTAVLLQSVKELKSEINELKKNIN